VPALYVWNEEIATDLIEQSEPSSPSAHGAPA
jgi:hypothetical protein